MCPQRSQSFRDLKPLYVTTTLLGLGTSLPLLFVCVRVGVCVGACACPTCARARACSRAPMCIRPHTPRAHSKLTKHNVACTRHGRYEY